MTTPTMSAALKQALEALREALEFQSAPEGPTIHDWGRWRRAADAAEAELSREQPARIRFTQAQMRRLYDNSPEFHCDVTSRYGFYRIVALTERAHNIPAVPAQETMR